ncbi:hypothetical protein [Streptomyces sp. SH5]|uniref:hypothetical protein n=1 Tax=Streptomyces sp. SH5 TaxID=3041765 RepID=UPI002477E6C0|nr:hypothetical protein [Streptomyces sp. SH5]WGP14358.1 hypothetical protein QFA72_34145 [Streptomyces sp. SH5]
MEPLTVGNLREILDRHGVTDDSPIVIHADILDAEYASILRLESVHIKSVPPHGTSQEEGSSIPLGYGHATSVILSAGLGEEEYVRKDSLHPTTRR